MSRTRTLAQLRSDVENQSDIVGASARYSPTLLNRLINQSIQRFRERVSIEGSTRYLTQTSGTLTTGAASGLPFQVIELASAQPNCVRTFGVDLTINGQIVTLEHRPFEERTKFGNRPAVPIAWAPYGETKVAIMPPPVGSYPYTIWYLPLLPDLTADSDAWDGVAGWEDFIVWDVFQRLATRDTYEKVFAQASVVKDQIVADIIRGATKVSHAGGAHRGRDTMGALGVLGFGQGRRGPAAGGGLPPDDSVTNGMLAQMVARTIKGNFAYGPANPQDLTGAQVADIIPVFAGAAGGLVPTGAGNNSLFLTNAGNWVAPSIGGSVSGVAFSQLENIPGPRVLGNMGPTGPAVPLLGQQVASMIGVFTGSAHGLVPYPSGGTQGFVLDDSGKWVAQSGGAGTGLSNAMMLAMPPLSFKGNFGSTSGGPSDLTKREAASLMPDFTQASGAGRGFVWAPTGGVAGNFLRDDGSWQTPAGGAATGVGNAALLPMAPLSVKGNFGSTSGAVADLNKQQFASLAPNFFQASGATRGFVFAPTGGVSNRFLRDDGSFQSPPSGVQLAASGVQLPQLGDIQSPRFLGRITAGSGAIEQLTPNQAASMLPNFFAPSGGPRGLVYAPTGGAIGAFLRDDGSFQPVSGGGGGPTMLAAEPAGSVQYNGGSGFAGATGIRAVGSGQAFAFGQAPAATGLLQFSHNDTAPIAGGTPSGSTALLMQWATHNGYTRALLHGDNGNVEKQSYHVATGGKHEWQVNGAERAALDTDKLQLRAGMRLGLQQLALPDTVGDKLGSITASGFINHATGINITGSGTRLTFGSGGPQIHASGIDLRSGDIRNVRRLNGLDGIKLYGDLPDSNASVVAPSGTVFIVPLTTTQGRVYSAEPSGAEHGDVVLIENRSAFSHSIYNTGTGMGAPSGWIATLAPSGGVSIRFASGAWEFGSKYKLGGF